LLLSFGDNMIIVKKEDMLAVYRESKNEKIPKKIKIKDGVWIYRSKKLRKAEPYELFDFVENIFLEN